MKSRSADDAQSVLHEKCSELMEHVRLLRDYATTPDNIWLARSELSQIQELSLEIEALLAQIKAAQS